MISTIISILLIVWLCGLLFGHIGATGGQPWYGNYGPAWGYPSIGGILVTLLVLHFVFGIL